MTDHDNPTASQDRRYKREQQRDGKVPLDAKIYQGIGALADTYKNFAFGTFVLFYYNQVLGMPAFYASIAIMVALVIDAVTDPLVGSFSDGLQTRLGRRHPLMYASALPLGLTLFLLFVPPDNLDSTGLFIWLTIFAVAVRVSMTLFQVPWNAMFAEFSDDYAERSQIVTFRYLCGWIGGTVFVWCTWTFIFPSTEEYTPGHMNPDSYLTFAIVLGVAVTTAVLLTTHLTRNQIPFLLQPQQSERFTLPKVWSDVKAALTNKDFVILFFGLFMMSVLGGTTGAFELYINTYFWGLLPEDLRWLTLTIIGSMFAFVVIPLLQSRFDKKHLLVFFMMFLLINGIGLILLRFADLLPKNGEPMLLIIIVANEVVRTAAGTVVAIMFVSMVADTLDKQELETGRRQEGVFSSAMTFAGKATSGVGILLGGLILDYVLAFPQGVDPNDADPGLIFDLGLYAGVMIPLFYLIPFWFVTRYDITRETHSRIQEELIIRRRQRQSGEG
ncbi:MAG: MFS transporter [Gammaproteobacteria bacterium]|nr:MFS transporter [Gammaproteobacteria bacterium]